LKLKDEVPQRLMLVNKEIYHLVVFFIDWRLGIAPCHALVIQIILCEVRKFLKMKRVCTGKMQVEAMGNQVMANYIER
jgi:hypothetical protein